MSVAVGSILVDEASSGSIIVIETVTKWGPKMEEAVLIVSATASPWLWKSS